MVRSDNHHTNTELETKMYFPGVARNPICFRTEKREGEACARELKKPFFVALHPRVALHQIFIFSLPAPILRDSVVTIFMGASVRF